ncbi:MAG: T9SS type A sorting domain-containing protein [Bacteroidota bacterium]
MNKVAFLWLFLSFSLLASVSTFAQINIAHTITQPTYCYYGNGKMDFSGLTPSSSFQLHYTKNGSIQPTIDIKSTPFGSYELTHLGPGTYTDIYVSNGSLHSNILGPVVLNDAAIPIISLGSVKNPATCQVSNGAITIKGFIPNATYTFTYTKNSSNIYKSPLMAVNDTGCFIITGLTEGLYEHIQFKSSATGCASTTLAPIELKSDPNISYTLTNMAAVCGDSTGNITLYGLYPGAKYSVDYTKNNISQHRDGLVANRWGGIDIIGLGAGTYDKIKASPADCDISTAITGPIQITATAVQNVLIKTVPGNVVSPTDTVIFIAKASNTGRHPRFLWQKNGVPVQGHANFYMDHHFKNGDIITCTVTSILCSELSTAGNNIIMSVVQNNSAAAAAINNVTLSSGFRLFPNPTNSILFVDSKEPVNIEVTDINGKIVREMRQDKYVDMSKLANGIYLIHLYNKEGLLLHVGRVVKE